MKSDNKKSKDKAWTIFSRYIRLRDCLETTGSIERGICYTCGKEFDYKDLQAGHCISGRGNYILLDEECVNAECKRCNIMLGGNYDVFIPKKIREFNLEWFEEKKRLSKIPVKVDWKERYEYFFNKVQEMTCSKGLPF